MIFVGHARHVVERDVDRFDVEQSRVDVTGVAVGATDGDRRAVLQRARRVAAADDRRNAELARDDRRMAGATAAVGDDRARALHHRFPVGIGQLGDEDVTRLHAVHFARRLHEPHRPLADLLADRAAARERLAA